MVSPSTPGSGGSDTGYSADWRVRPAGAVVRVRGALDMRTAPELAGTLTDASDAGTTEVYLDLRGLHVLGSAGLRVLITGHQGLSSAGRRLVVVATQLAVLRVLRVTGLDTVLTVRAELPEAELPQTGSTRRSPPPSED
ncbi:MAG TPA: STAS domain-containing protein [Pseudonocardiaceae bacterium]|jgi:anti-sigma B factor antagonist|nr:STAS domain-containing protein [Pseudonocardiaceae bacterium]